MYLDEKNSILLGVPFWFLHANANKFVKGIMKRINLYKSCWRVQLELEVQRHFKAAENLSMGTPIFDLRIGNNGKC